MTRRIADPTLDTTPAEPVVENKRKRIKRRKEAIPDDAVEIEKVEEEAPKPEMPDFDSMTKKELVDLLKERDLPVSGKKSELIERLMKWVEEG
ncbi:MAG: SAP domain-containing protein [Candidatus Thermoplasmatota archaeon]|nr:SAP domain-containing protein [Candidatus Thermoplasmatota archaeon]